MSLSPAVAAARVIAMTVRNPGGGAGIGVVEPQIDLRQKDSRAAEFNVHP
jgi:hypothetical protein